MTRQLQIQPFTLGAWATNCYVVHTGPGTGCWIVDAGFEPAQLIEYIQTQQLTPERVVLTHAHVDHIAALQQVIDVFGPLPIHIHEAEQNFLTDTALNLSAYLPDPVVAPEATDLLQHGDTLTLDGYTFSIRHTPGHSPGGVCLYNQANGVALVGDTLFDGSIGRHDFPTSNFDDLQTSIIQQLYTLPDDTAVLPGHMSPTTIGKEKTTNPFVRLG